MDFKKRYNQIFENNAFDKLIKSQKQLQKEQYIRFNQTKITKSAFFKFLKDQRVKFSITQLENLIKIEKSFFNISSSILNLNGYIYIQEYASSLPVFGLEQYLKKNLKQYQNIKLRILDACASPGSKLTQLIDNLEMLNLKYELTALEPNEKRLTKLINNLQRQNLINSTNEIKIIQSNAQDFKTENNELFDIILLDVPCSGNLITDKNWLKKRDLEGIKKNSKLQKQIFENSYKLTKKNGIIIYSTCSLEPEENEDNISYFLENYKISLFEPVKFNFDTTPLKNKNKQIKKAYRFIPYKTKTQGFFLAYIKKEQ